MDKELIWIVALLVITKTLAFNEEPCGEPLGMQSGSIPDSSLSASSEYDESLGAVNSRLNKVENGGAWCPKSVITNNADEWLQIDLEKLHIITHVETQGRFGPGQGYEYSPHYLIEYQRKEGEWIRFRNQQGNEIMEGNSNSYSPVERELRPHIIANKIRIIPFCYTLKRVCMRVELKGCLWASGILSYSMNQGDRFSTDVELYDFSYDGKVLDGYLSGGLGQLVDGQLGLSNIRIDQNGDGRRGYEWVGWKNETNTEPPVEIIFEFDKVYNFSEITLNCNNKFTKEIMVFEQALVYFSIGGTNYQEQPVVFRHFRDYIIDLSRNIIIPIPFRIGRFVKIQLLYAKKWILVSEIYFKKGKFINIWLHYLQCLITHYCLFVELAEGEFADESDSQDECNSTSLQGYDHESCRDPLGMQSGSIPDSSLNASSEYDIESVGVLSSSNLFPERLNTEVNGGAWCPRNIIDKDVYEWIQIDLGKVKVVTHVVTQGRFGNGQGTQFAPFFMVEYQKGKLQQWNRFHDEQGNELLKGNDNTYIAVERPLNPPIIAQRIRIIPYSDNPIVICMRIELLGCEWSGDEESGTTDEDADLNDENDDVQEVDARIEIMGQSYCCNQCSLCSKP